MKKLGIIICMACAGLYGCRNSDATGQKTVELSGSGATFPAPYYNLVFKTFEQQTANQVSYGGVGSGGGIRSLKDGIVDFAGSDAFLSDEEMKNMPSVIHIPTCLGAVVLAYHLQGITSLNLSGEVVADVFMGKITHWDDARIQSLNAAVALPHKRITPVYRSDGSGTTFVFTDYLSKASTAWKEQLGSGKSVNFPTGIAAKGNPGVSGNIAQTDGSIGYIGSEYAFAQQIAIANMQNKHGEFITPSTQTISAAAQAEVPDDMRCMITDSEALGAYPISCFTWMIVYREQNYSNRSLAQAQTTAQLLKFILNDQMQQLSAKVHYAPLPEQVKDKALKAISGMVFNGEKLSETE